MAASEPFESEHFVLEGIREGVWAALHRPGGGLIANAGIVDLGGATLVFDTGLTPEAAADLRRACRALTGRDAEVVLNSHYHNDHVRGNQTFPGSRVVSGPVTRELLDTRGRDELRDDARFAAERLRAYEGLLGDPDPLKRRAAETFVPYFRAMQRSAPDVALVLADETVAEAREFRGEARPAVFRVMGGAHTPEDAVLELPDDGVVFCGDLLFVEAHPYLGHGDPAVWRRVLAALEGLDAAAFVPGHGPVSGVEGVRALRRYLDAVEGAARRGGAPEAAKRGAAKGPAKGPAEGPGEVPMEYARWEFALPFWEANLAFLRERPRAPEEAS